MSNMRTNFLGLRNLARGAALAALPLCLANFAYSQAPDTQTPTPAAATGSPVSVKKKTDWTEWQKHCSDVFHVPKEKGKSFFACASSTFRSRPFHFVAQSILPGSGVGGGGRFEYDPNKKSNGAQNQFVATSVITIRQFWFAQLKFSSQIPLTAGWNKSTPHEALGLNIYARNRSLPVMTFYGLGPNTNVNNSVKFSQRDTSAGIEIRTPFPEISWLAAGGKIEGLWPSVGGVTGTNVISIQQQYTEQTAPGLTTQPPMVHEQLYLNPHRRLRGAFFDHFALDYHVSYNFYQDTNRSHFSFRRLEAMAEHRYYPNKRKHGGVIEDNFFSVNWRYSVSDASAGKAVPFYLQETIGGSDIDNQPSLRAFKDYRFRGPDFMTVQAEYYRKLCAECAPCKKGTIRTVCEHLGLLLAYGAGKVALRKSDLDFSGMHQSFGGGISIYMGKDVVFRMAVALGGGEGVHPYFGIANFL
jgi:hypothetical protein